MKNLLITINSRLQQNVFKDSKIPPDNENCVSVMTNIFLKLSITAKKNKTKKNFFRYYLSSAECVYVFMFM